jgi:hypothetical protein
MLEDQCWTGPRSTSTPVNSSAKFGSSSNVAVGFGQASFDSCYGSDVESGDAVADHLKLTLGVVVSGKNQDPVFSGYVGEEDDDSVVAAIRKLPRHNLLDQIIRSAEDLLAETTGSAICLFLSAVPKIFFIVYFSQIRNYNAT